MNWYSQAGQDEWVHGIIGDSGFFVDVGAYDGVQTSNSYALEKNGWKGICIEAEFGAFARCTAVRNCMCINRAVTNYSGIIGFGHDSIGGNNQVHCDTLQGILRYCNAPKEIDYLSMDIEGHELTVLEAFPFDEFSFKLITIEHNLYCDGPQKKNALYDLLTRHGYRRVIEDVKCLDTNPIYFNQPYEDWYSKI
jgi:FkbM family methyltransferase